jgi:hypothetical protein
VGDVTRSSLTGRAAARVGRSLVSAGAFFMPAEGVSSALGADGGAWAGFAAHWEELSPDRYAAAAGTCRLRRYGRFAVVAGTGEVRALPHVPFLQPARTNPLYEEARHFDPLTGAFAADPLLRGFLGLLGGVAGVLDGGTRVWHAQVHPFRVEARPGGGGEPTPEGRHRDGVTLVSSLLVGRCNVAGGESSVCTPAGRRVLAVTLRERGSLLLGDDRRTLHAVSPIRPLDGVRPGRRDVLVVTLTPA